VRLGWTMGDGGGVDNEGKHLGFFGRAQLAACGRGGLREHKFLDRGRHEPIVFAACT